MPAVALMADSVMTVKGGCLISEALMADSVMMVKGARLISFSCSPVAGENKNC